MITAVIDESLSTGQVRMDAPTLEVMNELRTFMFERVYLSPTSVSTPTTRSTSCVAWSTTISRIPTRFPTATATQTQT